jgi:uncharacterized membrane protein
MKKGFGIFLLFIGLIITNVGVAGIVETERTREYNQNIKIYGDANEIHFSLVKEYEQGLVAAVAFIVVGLLLFIIGIVLTATKTKKQREIEMELKVLKSMNG